MISCQLHVGCDDPAVAKIGLPQSTAIWVCARGFQDWQEGKIKDESLGAAASVIGGIEDDDDEQSTTP